MTVPVMNRGFYFCEPVNKVTRAKAVKNVSNYHFWTKFVSGFGMAKTRWQPFKNCTKNKFFCYPRPFYYKENCFKDLFIKWS
jgi:hypothetical protein